MNILDTHRYKLVFYIEVSFHAPIKYINKWKAIKTECEGGENINIARHIISCCKLQTNKTLIYLNRCEGGIGTGNNNNINKQLRFRDSWSGEKNADNCIVLKEILGTKMEKWTYEELDDLIYAVIKTFNCKMKCDCIDGHIEMQNTNMECDDYLDSDSDDIDEDV